MMLHAAASALPEICRGLLQAGLGLALQSTLLLGSGLLAGRALRRHGPALASLIYRVTLTGALLAALVSLCVGSAFQPLWRVSLPPAADTSLHRARPASLLETGAMAARSAASPELPGLPVGSSALSRLLQDANRSDGGRSRLPWDGGSGRQVASAPASSGHEVPNAPRPLPAPRLGSLYVLLAEVWAAGALSLLLWLLLCQFHLSRVRRNSQPIRAGDAATLLQDLCEDFAVAAPLLLVSSRVRTPFLAGIWRPAIFLPAGYEGLFDGPALRAILAHELVHMARRDCAWNLLAQVTSAVGWVQPLLWALGRQMAQESEAVCDQEVVRREGNPRGYADCLLRLSERLLPTLPERVVGVGVAPFRSSLGRRIHEIMEGARHRPLSLRLRALVGLGAGAAVVLALLLVSAVAAPLPDGTSRPTGGDANGRRPALSDVPELTKPITYTETKIPLGELVQKVSADTGVRLTAAAGVADEPVAVVVKDLPARELLEQVADLLDYRWARHGKAGAWRYEIYQDVASKQREEKLREADWAAVDRRFQEELKRLLTAPELSPAEIRRLEDEEEETGLKLQRFTNPALRDAFLSSPQERERRRRQAVASWQSTPINRALKQFLKGVTPAQWEAMRQGDPVRFSTDPQPGELPLPEAIARKLRSSEPSEYPAGRQIYPDQPDVDAEIRQREKREQGDWSSATGYRVTLRLGPAPIPPAARTGPSLSLSVDAAPFRGGAPVDPIEAAQREWPHIGINIGPIEAEQWGDENTPERAAALARDPVLSARKLFKPLTKPQPAPGWGPNAIKVWRLSDLLPEVARTYGVNLIGDAYWSTPIVSVPRLASATPLPLYTLLDRMTAPRYHWERRGPVVRLRSRTWYFDRPREIPMRLVRRWIALAEQQGALPLEEYVRSLALLRDDQLQGFWIASESAAFPPAIADLSSIYSSRHALHLYASLSPGQQQALWDGRTIPVAELLPAQQALYLAAIREQTRYQPEAPDLRSWSSGSLSLRASPFVRIREVPDKGAESRTELVKVSEDGRARPMPLSWGRDQTLEAMEMIPSRAAGAARAAASMPGAGASLPAVMATKLAARATGSAEKRYPCVGLHFHWLYGPNAQAWSLLTVAASSHP
jgi:beta-lactamase regulating signal transducer with metallopeptidase domain